MEHVYSAIIANNNPAHLQDIWSAADAAYYEQNVKNVALDGVNGADLTEIIAESRGKPRTIQQLYIAARDLGRSFDEAALEWLLSIECQRMDAGHVPSRAVAAGA